MRHVTKLLSTQDKPNFLFKKETSVSKQIYTIPFVLVISLCTKLKGPKLSQKASVHDSDSHLNVVLEIHEYHESFLAYPLVYFQCYSLKERQHKGIRILICISNGFQCTDLSVQTSQLFAYQNVNQE